MLTKTNQTTTNQVTAMDVEQEQENVPALALKLTPRHDTIGIKSKETETQFCATVAACDIPDDDSARAPVDIVVALDVSGSMTGRKLDLCKETLTVLLRELSVRDRFGLITFGSEATIQISPKKMTKENKESAISKIKKLQTSGCTNMSGGIGLAAQELQSVETPSEVRTIFLLTDGLANMGVSDNEGIVKLTKGCLTMDKGQGQVAIHCFGYGSDHDREMLRDISQATEGGSYYFVENDSDVSTAFGDALGGILSVVAQNTVLQLDVAPEASKQGVKIVNVLHDKAVKQDDGSFKVDVADFYAEESRDILFTVALADTASSTPVPHVSARISYLDTINKKLAKSDFVLGSVSRPTSSEVSALNEHVAIQYLRVRTTEVISQVEDIAKGGNLAVAKSTITAHIEYLTREASKMNSQSPLIAQLHSELNTILSGLSSKASYESGGSAYIQTRRMNHSKQRCAESSMATANVYRAKKKIAWASKLSKK